MPQFTGFTATNERGHFYAMLADTNTGANYRIDPLGRSESFTSQHNAQWLADRHAATAGRLGLSALPHLARV